jgi:hypothetical protein
MQGIRNQLGKHDIGGHVRITNNREHFQNVDMRWSKMEKDSQDKEKDNQDQKEINQRLEKWEAIMNKQELFKTVHIIRYHLRILHERELNHRSEDSKPQSEAQAEAIRHGDSTAKKRSPGQSHQKRDCPFVRAQSMPLHR